MNTQCSNTGARIFRKAVDRWVCPSCSLAKSRRPFSRSAQQAQQAQQLGGQIQPLPISPKTSKAQSTSGTPAKRRLAESVGSGETKHDCVFSLIQPTGVPHLGNYLGAIRQWKDLEKQSHLQSSPSWLYFGLADLHSLTSLKQTASERKQNVKETYAALLALGLGNSKMNPNVLFCQSHITQHAELMWILSNFTSTGYLSRMTQYKDKLANQSSSSEADQEAEVAPLAEKDFDSGEKLKLGLFSYPVLQAADILLYGATHVPVGEDQAQHVELTRYIARAFNSATGIEVFIEPKLMLSPAKRIMSLQNPSKKMSKSDPDEKSRILVTDSPDQIRWKLRKARTDTVEGPITYDPASRPGVSNLIDIYKHITRSPLDSTEIAAQHAEIGWENLKNMVAEAIIEEFEGVREEYERLMDNDEEIIQKMKKGKAKVSMRASKGLHRVKRAVGLNYADVRPQSGRAADGP